jgi:phosphoribosylglycinamide formyltransferase-1
MARFQNHQSISVALLLSNKADAFALQRAAKFGVANRVFNRQQFTETGEVIGWLKEAQITHVVLAGFLWLIPQSLLEAFPDQIINIHPSLLPRFGGKGMYGHHVHEAVKAAGEVESGMSIHLVNTAFDEGRILFQTMVNINTDDNPDDIADKVLRLEHKHFAPVIEQWILGQTIVGGGD